MRINSSSANGRHDMNKRKYIRSSYTEVKRRIYGADGDEDFEGFGDIGDEEEGFEDTLDDMQENLEDMQDDIDEIQEDDVDIDMENNIDGHYIAECDKCHGIFISAMMQSDQEVEKISGICPLCEKESDQYLKWVVQPIE